MFGWLGKLFLKLIGGSRNERIIRARMEAVRELINPLEPEMRALGDAELLERSDDLRRRLAAGAPRNDIRSQAFALVREASRRGQNHRQFDVQLVAGMILDESRIAEEATGEGKTIACYPAIYMAVVEGLKAHVVTVNDYLVQRDAEFARPIFDLLGMTVGFITSGMDNAQRQTQYACDVTYGTNSEFGFDFLRDNMKLSTGDQVQGQLGFAIIDEVDSILIDEARTPLIISGPAYGQTDRYRKADGVARELIGRHRPWDRANKHVEALKRSVKALHGEVAQADGDQTEKILAKLDAEDAKLAEAENALARHSKYYEVELDRKSVHMTHEGVGAAQEIAGIGSFYVGANMEWPHLMDQSLCAHLVYERDKDYVVQNGEVVIVDQFTGRLLEGREWSYGLHQSVCAKEHVTIKEENQTLATITIQNYFKLYKKLAGMTGTAMTEAEEFMKIYSLDTVTIATHRPVNRVDHNDRIYADPEAKFNALAEEINRVSKQGRPVLVGTTSIEKSEILSTMLTRKYGTEHEVLNGRAENAARENEIVFKAGQQVPLKRGSKQMVGNVTIATNMAGRGTDIKLGPGVVCEKCKVPPAEELSELGLHVDDLFPPGTNKCCIHCPQYDPATHCAHCFKRKLDDAFPLRGRTDCIEDVPCGLHIVGTERHEARRIDNQLRGRSGRQGDPGSSRFFLSIRDELMAIFAGEWTLKVLGWLGLQGDVAIEDRRVSKGIARAQKKVEQRNFDTRKNLLEYDEVMDYQRRTFYSRRQKILEGRQLEGLVNEMIRDVVIEAVEVYLDGRYRQECIAEWAAQTLQIPIREDQIRAEGLADLESLEADLRQRAKDEANSTIAITLGEYMDEEIDARQWDLRGLSAWAMSRFKVSLSQNQLRRMQPDEVERRLGDSAAEQIDMLDLGDVAKYLADDFPVRSLAQRISDRFGIDVSPDDVAGDRAEATQRLTANVEAAYLRREIEYPVEHFVDLTVGQGGTENVYAVGALVDWANGKYQAGLTVEDLRDAEIADVVARLTDLSEQWTTGGRLDRAVAEALDGRADIDAAIAFARQRFDTELSPDDFDDGSPEAVRRKLVSTGTRFLRREMTELERFVLLQIYDSLWKDHLLAMDHLKSGIGLRGYAEQDPRVAYKREGAKLFQEMLSNVHDQVTDMIFKVRLSAEAEMASVYEISSMVHEQLTGYDHLARDMADQQAAAEPTKIETIVRDLPKVGRNAPCPCGSGKKFKKCCGKTG